MHQTYIQEQRFIPRWQRFCNQVEVFKSTIQNGLRSICECLKINPDAHISEQEVVCVIISGIKALQLKYSGT